MAYAAVEVEIVSLHDAGVPFLSAALELNPAL